LIRPWVSSAAAVSVKMSKVCASLASLMHLEYMKNARSMTRRSVSLVVERAAVYVETELYLCQMDWRSFRLELPWLALQN